MIDEPSPPTEAAIDARFRGTQAEVGMTDDTLRLLFELSPDELKRLAAGDLAVWSSRLDEEYTARHEAQLAYRRRLHSRQTEAASQQAAAVARVRHLLAAAGVPVSMRVGVAIQAGLVTIGQVNAALRDDATDASSDPRPTESGPVRS